jgi:hypothetical protein
MQSYFTTHPTRAKKKGRKRLPVSKRGKAFFRQIEMNEFFIDKFEMGKSEVVAGREVVRHDKGEGISVLHVFLPLIQDPEISNF